jgi:hypothetical protein
MKRKLIVLTVVLVGIGVGTVASAQGRHDEKPHGVTKTEAAAQDKAPASASSGVGGRHDERPHGMTKAKTKAKPKTDQPAADKSAPPDAKASAK